MRNLRRLTEKHGQDFRVARDGEARGWINDARHDASSNASTPTLATPAG
jgi:hypothetical protein